MFFLLIDGIKCFAADTNAVLKWCLKRADQARNIKAMYKITGIYSFSEKYKHLRLSQILMRKKLVSELITVLVEVYITHSGFL